MNFPVQADLTFLQASLTGGMGPIESQIDVGTVIG